MDKRLQHLLTLLITDKVLEGYLLSKFDMRVTKEDFGPKGPDGKSLNTAALGYANGRFHIIFHEDFLESLPTEQALAVLRHEAAHFIHRHFARKGVRDHMIFNVAADMAINQFIENLPNDCVKVPKGWPEKDTTETYYDLLEKNAIKIKVGGKASGKSKSNDGSDGEIRIQDDIEQGKSDIENSNSDSQAKQMIKDTVQARLNSGEDPEKMRGLYGGALESLIKELTADPMLNWKHALSRFAASFTAFDSNRTLKRPDRRQICIWGKRKERRPKMIVAIDTSGSVSDEMLIAFFSQVRILAMSLDEVRVIGCDANITLDVVYMRGLERKLHASGRGGTDFEPVILHVNKEYADYDGLVYLTDGYCPVPDTRSKVRTLWVVCGNREFPGKPTIFAEDPANKARRKKR